MFQVIHYQNSFDILVKVTRTEGPLAWYKGLTPALLKNCVVSGVSFVTFEFVCQMIKLSKFSWHICSLDTFVESVLNFQNQFKIVWVLFNSTHEILPCPSQICYMLRVSCIVMIIICNIYWSLIDRQVSAKISF